MNTPITSGQLRIYKPGHAGKQRMLLVLKPQKINVVAAADIPEDADGCMEEECPDTTEISFLDFEEMPDSAIVDALRPDVKYWKCHSMPDGRIVNVHEERLLRKTTMVCQGTPNPK